ncbi:unnamed protein product [Prunus armeniaca]
MDWLIGKDRSTPLVDLLMRVNSDMNENLSHSFFKALQSNGNYLRIQSRVLAHLYSLPKAKYVPVCTDGDSFTFSNKSCNSQSQPIPKAAAEVNPESGGSKGVLAKLAIDKLKDSKESDESMPIEGEAIEDFSIKSKSERKMESSGNKSWDRDRERGKETETGIE